MRAYRDEGNGRERQSKEVNKCAERKEIKNGIRDRKEKEEETAKVNILKRKRQGEKTIQKKRYAERMEQRERE